MYLIDANIFIQAKRGDYAFDLCPGFWTWLEDANGRGVVYSIGKVRDELAAGGDDLAAWISTRGGLFRPDADPVVLAHMVTVATWTNGHPQYTAGAKATFLGAADSFLVAHALASGFTVVTREVSRPMAQAAIKLPDACAAIGVTSITPQAMLRAQGVAFYLP